MRWLGHRLSRELFGRSVPLYEFPPQRSVRGLGLSDPEVIAQVLRNQFTYCNTFYDRSPQFDIRNDRSPVGDLDFLIASEVFEHVSPPIGDAFRNAARLLKPSGVFLLTVPWVYDGSAEHRLPPLHDWKLTEEDGQWLIVNRTASGDTERYSGLVFDGKPGPSLGATREHFPNLFDWKLVEYQGTTVLENHRRDGTLERFQNLSFHGGTGQVLEMRIFTKGDLQEHLASAGFRRLEFESDDYPAHGIFFPYPWSRPIVARRS